MGTVCQVCGLEAPTARANFHQNIGMFFARSYSHATGDLCRTCIRKYFKSYTLTTLFLGWWGLISFFITPIFLVGNIFSYLRTLSLPDPGFAAMNNPLVESGGAAAATESGVVTGPRHSFKFKLLYGMVVWSIVLIVILQDSPKILDKYAPKLNAYLHSGVPSTDADIDYHVDHFSKAFETYKTLADASCPEKATFKQCRAQILATRSVLDDMGSQHRALSAAWAEQKQSQSIPDSCKIPMNEYLLAIDEYWTVEDKFLRVFDSINPDSEESIRQASPQLKQLSAQEDAAVENLTVRARKVSTESGSPCKDY